MFTRALRRKSFATRAFALLLCLALAVPLSLPTSSVWGTDNAGGSGSSPNPSPQLATEQPALLVSGDEIIGGGVYTADNVSFEKSYTLDELMEAAADDSNAAADNQYLFTTINNSGTKSFYLGEGVRIDVLLGKSGAIGASNSISVRGPDGFSISFNPNEPRYFYPNLYNNSVEGAIQVPALITWAGAGGRNETPIVSETSTPPDSVKDYDGKLGTMVGQLNVADINNPLFSSAADSQTIVVGGAITGKLLTVDGKGYTRAEVLMMPRAQNVYTYSTSGDDKTDLVRGVRLSDLLADLDDDAVIEFHAADDYDVSMTGMTKSELVAGNAILAYETYDNAEDWQGIYSTAKKGPEYGFGFFSLYVSGMQPAKMIDKITFSNPEPGALDPYKHITAGGIYSGSDSLPPYKIDALTGATLTVEGPGVVNSIPITVGDLENTKDSNIYRGVYADNRGDFSYEGVTLLSILDGLVNAQVERLNDDVVVVFKDRWRHEIGRATYNDIKNASTPIILAYGTASADETTIPPLPFVFNLAAGISKEGLGNDDGPLKLVFNQNDHFPSVNSDMPVGGKFTSVANLYIEEGTPPPGFKHTDATDDAYRDKANTEYLVTFTGAALGREVNYTVAELENMVAYGPDDKPLAGGKGYRAEYGLSNTTYWTVDEYEGIKVWDLLTSIGVDAVKYKDDDNTFVSFSAWDNYIINIEFSMRQLANPDLFYLYEKSPLDNGSENRPTKAQLSDDASNIDVKLDPPRNPYQPDNQTGDGWTTDDNGYPVKKGYPVMLAYGLNGYPYVRDASLPGFKGGLGNTGGPMRIIYGKADGLNRVNAAAEENYAYFFNNGSNQLQRLQEVYVGDETRYSTHLENPNQAYQDMKDAPGALTVEIKSDGTTKTETFTLAELESILYGQGINKSMRDLRQEKGYYVYRMGGSPSAPIQDLFEGVSLEYLLTEYIGMQGTLGSLQLYSGANLAATYDLATIRDKGKNSENGTDGLGMTVAFAKNGYPLVAGVGGSTSDIPGYVHNDIVTGKAIRNDNGPLVFVRGQTDEEYNSSSVESSGDEKTYVTNLTKIVVNLEPDVYAHVGAVYETYANQNVLFSGAVSLESGVNLKVGALETLQKYMVTDSYTVGGVSGIYRGLNLQKLLHDSTIGANALMNEITVKNANGDSKTLTLAELADKKAILAYGIAGGGGETDGKPLVPNNSSAGYETAYQNSGGPMRLIFEGGAATDCVTDVSEIEVSTIILDGWKHTGGDFLQYANNTLDISGQNLVHNKTYTVAEIEAMDNIIVSDTYLINGSMSAVVQGVDLYKLLQNIGFATGNSSAITVTASDGYAQTFGADQLKNGINNKPILVIFGQGPKADNGLPLVSGDNAKGTAGPGYDANVGNDGGPLRLLVNNGSGLSVKNLVKIVVGAAGGNPDPDLINDFEIRGLKSGLKTYSISQLTNLPGGMGTKIASYSYSGGADAVKGAYLYDLLKANGVSDNALVTVNTTDQFETTSKGVSYCDIPMSDIKAQEYFVAYSAGPDADNLSAVSDADKQALTAKVRIYRNFNDGSDWRNQLTNIKGVTVADFSFNLYPGGVNDMPQASIRSVVTDSAGGIWAGSNGAGAAYISATGKITKYSTPTLKTDFVTGISLAPDGSVWMSQGGSVGSQNAPPTAHYGFANYKNGQFTFYNTGSENSTLPNDCVYGVDVDKDGNVWLTTQHTLFGGGMEGGLTKFDPATNTWRTWMMDSGLPTVSAWAVKNDGKGGAWVTTYRTSNPPYDNFPWSNQSYAHVGADGVVKPYDIPAGNDFTWSRSIAIDPDGGVYITRMSGAHDPTNTGGYLDYIAPNGTVTCFSGDSFISDLKAKATQGFYPEIRTAFVDKGGDLWLSTNGLGVYRCSVSGGKITINEHYSSENNSWPAGAFDDVWSIYVSPDGKAYFGSNGGVAWTNVTLATGLTVLDPPFTIKQAGKPDITWAIGGSGNSIKNLSDNAGKIEKTFMYDGAEKKVRGASLSTILAASGISGDKLLITFNTTDNFQRPNYIDVPIADIVSQDYFVAYDIYNPGTDNWDKIADVDSGNVQASLRVYRNFDAGASGNKNNEVKGLSGITVTSSSTPGPGPGTDYVSVGGATPDNYDFKIVGSVEKPVYFTMEGLKNRYPGQTRDYYWLNSVGTTGTDTFTGVDLETLLKDADIVKLVNAESINVAAGDGFNGDFNLDTSTFGVYGTAIDGNKMMLAWRGNESRDKRNIIDYTLPRLAIGQKETGHINRSNWITDIKTITVKSSVSKNPGTTPSYVPSTISDEVTPLAQAEEIIVTLNANTTVAGGVVDATNTKEEVNGALDGLKAKAEGKAVTTNVLRIDAATEGDTVKTIYTMPADALSILTGDGKTNVVLITDQGSVSISADILQYLDSGGKDPLIIEIEKVDAPSGDLAAVNITIRIGNTVVNTFNNILLKADIPFVLTGSMLAEGIVVYNVAGNGEKTLIKLAAYNADTKSVKLGLKHLSEYSIGYNPVTFADIQKHWGKSSIEFLAARDIVNGRSSDAFDPDGKVTRAEFVKMLAESVDGVDVSGAASAGFGDIPGNAWYTGYVNWAAGLGIVQGNPDGTFQPDGLITREQMAAMTDRFISAMKYDLKVVQDAANFTDQAQISSYATSTVRRMQQYGIMNGNPDGSFNPKGTATRAESAKVVKTLIEAVLL